jgi:hypothetical protein
MRYNFFMAVLKNGEKRQLHGIREADAKARKDVAVLNKVGTTSIDEVRYAKDHGIPEIYRSVEAFVLLMFAPPSMMTWVSRHPMISPS